MSGAAIRRPERLQRTVDMLVLASTLRVGGGEMVLHGLLPELVRRGIRPTLLTLKEPGEIGDRLANRGIEVISWGLRGTRGPFVLPRLLALIRQRRFGLIYVQDHHDCLFWGRLAAALAGFIPVVSPVHSSAEGELVAFRLYNRILLGLSPNLVTLGAWQQRALRDREGVPEGFWRTIPNPVDVGESNAAGPPRAARRDRLVLGAVAALRPEKRHDLMLELTAVLARSRDVELWLIGDGDLRGPLERLGAELGIDDRVRFLGRRDDVPALLARIDLFLLTSSEEALPLCVLEAMAARVPVAATPHGALPSLLRHGRRGCLLRGEDPAAWAGQVDRFLDRPPSTDDLDRWGRDVAREHAPELFVERYVALLNHLGGDA